MLSRMSFDLLIEISNHAREQMAERGVSQEEVIAAIRKGQSEPALKGRTLYRKNFQFGKTWRGKVYAVKQVAPVVAHTLNKLVVVTVYSYYF